MDTFSRVLPLVIVGDTRCPADHFVVCVQVKDDSGHEHRWYLDANGVKKVVLNVHSPEERRRKDEWQFTPSSSNLEAARQYSWPSTLSFPNQVELGCFKASNYPHLFTYVSGIELNNPDVVDAQTVALIVCGLEALYNRTEVLPEVSFFPVRFVVLRDLVTIFEFAAQHQFYAVGL